MDNLILKASRFAYVYHDGQVRGGSDEPYYFHCARVAALTSSFADSTENMVIAAWLHDTLEDTVLPIDDIAREFGEDVLVLVKDLTNKYTKRNFPWLNRARRKHLEANRLSQCCSAVKLIKLCDRLDNVSDTQYLKDKRYYVDETYNLVNRIGGDFAWLKNEIFSKLEEIENASS